MIIKTVTPQFSERLHQFDFALCVLCYIKNTTGRRKGLCHLVLTFNLHLINQTQETTRKIDTN